MRLTWVSAVLLLAAAAPAVAMNDGATQQSMSDVSVLTHLNAERLEAYRTRDKAALDRILADDFVAVRTNGAKQSKAALIDAVTSPIRDIRRVTWDNVRIDVHGDTAYVSGRNYIEGTSDGRDISSVNQYADVYVRRGGEWKMTATRVARGTATHLTFVPVTTTPGAAPVELAAR